MAVKTIISVEAAFELANARFIDCRFDLADPAAGSRAFRTEHIPGAQYVDLDQQLSGTIEPGKTGRHPLPEIARLTNTMRSLGISNEQPVIAYDQNSGAFASRFWWLLRYLGHEQVAVLDGGLTTWIAAGYPTTAENRDVTPSEFEANSPLTKTVDADALGHSPLNILDARDEPRFRGIEEPIDPIAGDIPGAQCMPFSANLNAAGRFKSREALQSQFNQAGLSPTKASICYCGSGVTACHNVLALVHAGYPEPYLYPGSWSEWITDPTRPIATGA